MDKLLRPTFRILLAWIFLLNLSLTVSAGDEKSKTTDTNWPSFRGRYASGVADGQNLPDQWNGGPRSICMSLAVSSLKVKSLPNGKDLK